MHKSLRIAIIIVGAALVLGTLTFVTLVRTYTVQVVPQMSYVLWNDRQLVIFVQSVHVGASSTLLQQVTYPATRWLKMPPLPQERRAGNFITILRFENGTLQPPVEGPVGAMAMSPLLGRGQDVYFVDGRPLVPGGAWNGREIEPVKAEAYTRALRSATAADAHGWHAGSFVTTGGRELSVQVRGEAATVKGSRSGTDAWIDLVHAGAAPMRVFDVKLASHPVSAREYESSFPLKPNRPGVFTVF
jgi:hypothetical protein